MHLREAERSQNTGVCDTSVHAVRGLFQSALLLVALLCGAGLIVKAAPGRSDGQTTGPSSPERSSREVRALWVARTSLVSPTDVAKVVDDARRYGFNTLLVQVRGRGDAYFNGGIEPRAELLAGQAASFDPLQELIATAHPAEIEVHAWISVNLVSSATTLPTSRDHVVHAHPEWLMVPRDLARRLGKLDPSRPEYVQRLAAWTRAHNQQTEGLFVSPIAKDAAAHTHDVVTDLVRRYPVDGVHLDYVRYPNAEFDYSRAALEAFRAEIRPTLAPEASRRLDAARESDVTAYADAFQDAWDAFRRTRLTHLVERLASAVRAVRPTVFISAAVIPDPTEATNARLQEWPTWLERGLIDVICPMMYTSSAQRFAGQADLIQDAAGSSVWVGIGAWQLSPAETVQRIEAARARNFAGVALFSYDSLAARRRPFLTTVDRRAFQATANGAPGSR